MLPSRVTVLLTAATTLILYVVTAGFPIFVLPVLASVAKSGGQPLADATFIAMRVTEWVLRGTVALFVGWLIYARRRPSQERPAHVATALGVVNLALAACAAAEAAAVVNFVIILPGFAKVAGQ